MGSITGPADVSPPDARPQEAAAAREGQASEGLADSLSGVVHAAPGAQLGRGVVEPQLCFRDLDLAQFLQHLCALGTDRGVSGAAASRPSLSSKGSETLYNIQCGGRHPPS